MLVREKWDTPMGEVYPVPIAELGPRLTGIQNATFKLYSKLARMCRRQLITNGMYVYYVGMILPHLRKAGTYDKACADYAPPAQKFGAHVAGLGMRFYTGTMFPPAFRGQVFIAEHGSWNRTKKSGYRVMRARLEGDRVVEHAVFAEGFLDEATNRAWGRPVDVEVMPDGALLVTDDHAHAIYRIALKGR